MGNLYLKSNQISFHKCLTITSPTFLTPAETNTSRFLPSLLLDLLASSELTACPPKNLAQRPSSKLKTTKKLSSEDSAEIRLKRHSKTSQLIKSIKRLNKFGPDWKGKLVSTARFQKTMP